MREMFHLPPEDMVTGLEQKHPTIGTSKQLDTEKVKVRQEATLAATTAPYLLGARAHIHLLDGAVGRDVEVEDVHGEAEGGAGVGDLYNTSTILPLASGLLELRCAKTRGEEREGKGGKKKKRSGGHTSTNPAIWPWIGAQLNSK